MTYKELTEFVQEAILILKEEMSDGYLTEREFHDYVNLFRMAADRVLAGHPQMREEVNHMIGPIIKLPSMIEDELRVKLVAEYEAKYEAKYAAMFEEKEGELAKREDELVKQKTEIAKQKAELAEKDAEIQRLQELVNQLTTDNTIS